jgi:hypothetical protein
VTELKLIRCSPTPSLDSIATRPLKIRGEATCSKRLPSSLAPSGDQTLPENLLRRLRRLDAEQLHIIMIVAAAIERGAP